MFNLFQKKFKQQKGFTLLEVLLVIAMIAILAAIVIVAINPAKQLAESRNAQRRSDVNTILNASYQYAIDHGGDMPTVPIAPTAAGEICKTTDVCGASPMVDLSALTLNEKYIVSMPIDPRPNTLCVGANTTCYTVVKSANGRITVNAPSVELGDIISVTR